MLHKNRVQRDFRNTQLQ